MARVVTGLRPGERGKAPLPHTTTAEKGEFGLAGGSERSKLGELTLNNFSGWSQRH